MRSMLVLLVCFVALSSFPAGQGRQAAPPAPPVTNTVAPDIPGVVKGGTPIVVLKQGLKGTEGPVALPDGSLIFTETQASLITKIDLNDNFTTFLENSNRSNGLGFDSKGRLISVQALSVGVIHPKDQVTTLAVPYEVRPNDLVVSSKDHIYFTLPGNKPPAVFHIPPGGKATFAGEAPSPHGIQLSHDEKTLYVADSYGHQLIAFDVLPDGKITNRRNFGPYVGIKEGVNSNGDGIAVDSEGRVYVGTIVGVQVLSPQGKNLGLIPMTPRPQNLAFAGKDKRTLYTVGGGVARRIQMIAQGHLGRAK